MPDFWSVADWKTAYGITVSDDISEDVLLDADESMQNYTTAEAYADALASGDNARLFKRVNGELALYYLDRRPQVGPKQVSESSKEYAGIKKYRQKYRDSAVMANWTEDAILSQLIEFKEESDTDFSATETWGTGRFVSGSLVISSTPTTEEGADTVTTIIQQSNLLEPSLDLEVSAGDTIPAVSYRLIRLISDGGLVTLTSIPNVQTTSSIEMNQILMLQGTSDTDMVEVQDETNLPNSGLHLQHGRNFTLGKNDILELLFNGTDWVELRRADNY